MCIDFRLKKMMIVEIVILVISDEKSLSFMEGVKILVSMESKSF